MNIFDIVSALEQKNHFDSLSSFQKRAMTNGVETLRALEELVFHFDVNGDLSSKELAAYENAVRVVMKVKQDLVSDLEFDKLYRRKA